MLKQLLVGAVLSTTLMGFVGCAKQEFQKVDEKAAAAAVGARFLPAKVDILVVPDNSASVNMAYQVLQAQFSGFIQNLSNRNWDYHVARSPISYSGGYYPIRQVLVNPKFNTSTLPDGTPNPSSGTVPSDRALTNASAFQILDGTAATDSFDRTFTNTYNTLVEADRDQYTGFLREDAPLAIVVVTNGYEGTITDVRGNYLSNGYSELQRHAANFLALKGGSKSLLHFFAIAANRYSDGNATSYCLTQYSASRPGTAYRAMSELISGPGLSHDFCDSSSLTNALNSIAAKLEEKKQSYVYSRIVLDREPVPSSIRVMRPDGTQVPEGPVDGWQYRGFMSDVPTITAIQDAGRIIALSPGLSRRTGYVIELTGSARFIGDQEPQIYFQRR